VFEGVCDGAVQGGVCDGAVQGGAGSHDSRGTDAFLASDMYWSFADGFTGDVTGGGVDGGGEASEDGPEGGV
jgi:hypothetical protein